MIRELVDRLIALLMDKARGRRAYATLFLCLTLPVLIVAVVSGVKTRRDLTRAALARRQAIVSLAAMTIKERMDRFIDLGVSLATRVRFRQAVAQGQWEKAADILKDVPKDLPAVDRIALIRPDAVLMADVPRVPAVHGQNYADRDWYTGVTREWKPYMSEAFLRRAEPRRNVVAVTIPIFDDRRAPVGILVVQIALENLFRWSEDIDPGGDGVLYVTDQKGRGVFHQRTPTYEAVRDLSGSEAVRRALAGETGILTSTGSAGEKPQLTAFGPVDGFGWTVGVQQSVDSVYSMRDRAMSRLALLYGVIVFVNVFLAYVILAVIGKLRLTATLLETSNKELEAFSYSVSHDLRTPLRAIAGFSQVLAEDYASRIDEEGRGHLQRIRAAAQNMGRLIDEILALSRITRVALKPERVDLSALGNAALAELRAGQPERNVQAVVQPGITALGDPNLLELVVRNLIGNAWKFTSHRADPRIELGAFERKGSLVVFVRDNGVGFNMAYRGKLFGLFNRLHTVDEFPGSGIGLATVDRVVRRHGGSVWAEGEVGQGATFYFSVRGNL